MRKYISLPRIDFDKNNEYAHNKWIIIFLLIMRQGFSLIELMVVLLIISILACFTYPSYKNYITRAHRIDGQTALFDLANRMEQYYELKNTYEKASIATGRPNDVLKNNLSPEGRYTLAITEATDTTFSLQATPNTNQAINDIHCQSLTLNSSGIKGSTPEPTESSKEAVRCW